MKSLNIPVFIELIICLGIFSKVEKKAFIIVVFIIFSKVENKAFTVDVFIRGTKLGATNSITNKGTSENMSYIC